MRRIALTCGSVGCGRLDKSKHQPTERTAASKTIGL